MHNFLIRLQNFQKTLSAKQAILLTKSTDINYFTGFKTLVPAEREAYLLISLDQSQLLYNAFSPISKFNGLNYHNRASLNQLITAIAKLMDDNSQLKELLIDDESLFVNEYQQIQNSKLAINKLSKNKIWDFRTIKNKSEIKLLTKAGQISIKAWEILQKKFIKPGISEKQLANQLYQLMIELGADSIAFPTIVAFGKHTALAHHQPTDKKLKTEMPVLLDFGAKTAGYGADMTRTIWFGSKPNAEFKKIEDVVRQAYLLGIKALAKQFNIKPLTLLEGGKIECGEQAGNDKLTKNGIDDNRFAKLKNENMQSKKLTALELDKTIRQYIDSQGYGQQFIHTSGHGIGLDIHEPPSLSYQNPQELKANMIIAVEPGIYLEGKFGFRYENSLWLK